MNFIQRIRQSHFVHDVLTLSTGTAIAQAIMIGILPVLTRLYTPEDFGVFTLYVSTTGLISIFASFRYEQMIMLTKSHRAASQLVWLILFISMGTSFVTFLIALLFRHGIAHMLGAPEIAPWLFGVPVSLFFLGTYNALRYWKMRLRQFSVVSRGGIGRSLAFAVISSSSKYTLPILSKSAGLISAQIISNAVNMLILFFSVHKQDRQLFAPASRKRIAVMARRHRDMAATLTASCSIGLLYGRLPHFLLSVFFGTAVLGFYSIAERIIAAPAQLISQAIGDVYRQRASVLYREQGYFDGLTLKTVQTTALLAIIPYAIAIKYAPVLFTFILGNEWEEAGHFASILLVGSFFSFIITPIYNAAVITNAKNYLFFSQFFRMVAKLCLIPLLIMGWLDVYGFLWAIVIIRITYYLVEAALCYSYSYTNKRDKL